MASPLDPLKSLFSYPADSSGDKDSRGLLAPTSRQLSKMRIIPVDGPRADTAGLDVYELLLNPNSVVESKSSNWVKHYVPGYDSPMLQWVNGTERVVSFTALVTKDLANTKTITSDTDLSQMLSYSLNSSSEVIDAYKAYPESEAKILKKMANDNNSSQARQKAQAHNAKASKLQAATAGAQTADQWLAIANSAPDSAFKKVAVPPTTTTVSKILPLSIANNLDFYRSLLLPRISKGSSSIVESPPLVELLMGSLLGAKSVNVKMRFILLNYNINVTKMTPDLTPIEAQVSFTFIEYTKNNRALALAEASTKDTGKKAIRNNSVTTKVPEVSASPLPTNTATGGIPFTPTA